MKLELPILKQRAKGGLQDRATLDAAFEWLEWCAADGCAGKRARARRAMYLIHALSVVKWPVGDWAEGKMKRLWELEKIIRANVSRGKPGNVWAAAYNQPGGGSGAAGSSGQTSGSY